ncbi:Metalloenzyme, LuxS/M16 peptidase-like protein [Scheffersomyces amazonensis]|uniref:Metalloenzyme, LuxS/M16 peptidase-like protein n=1 Tax=Scheffersomyces amazonensis TaxID=1078765 RepID=UPI00315CC03B
MVSTFVKQTSFEVDYAPSNITKWKSQRSGLQITYINQPSPIVNGYFAVATEIEDNSGSPHTLEHLVFMGSKKYPYKGLLDNLGNRLYSSTNAWTSVDQTVYTLTTAGWDGFKALLPVYLDHLLFPTLTDEACLTEVYHIDGEGKEKGVVFSEMQGIENQSWFISYLTMQQLLYSPKSGYSSETGGLTSELRSLTNEKIKQFHSLMYRPSNLCVIITGSVDEEELLKIMNEFDSELPTIAEQPQTRPFIDSPHDPPLENIHVTEVKFPDNDESMGELLISWIGPVADDLVANMGLDMVGAYLTNSPISLLNKHLVEIENPLATDIDYTTDDYLRTTINFTVSGVPTDKLHVVDEKIKQLILDQTNPDNVDVQYLRQVINQQRLKYISSTEKSASRFSNIAILDFIYGNPDGSDLSKWSKDLHEYDILLEWTADQWAEFIKKQLVNNKSATVIGVPSSELNKSLKKEKKSLSKSIKDKYGKDGLLELGEKLKRAQEKNDTPIPDSLLTHFEKPDPSKIAFIDTNSYKAGYFENILPPKANNYVSNDTISKLIEQDLPSNDFPLFIHFEDFKSKFTTINLVHAASRVESRLLSYLSIIEELFSLSIQLPNGKYIPYDQVVSELNDDLIEFNLDNGFENQFLELISVKVKFETTKYVKAIDWLLNVSKFSKFESSRVKIIVEKLINSLPDRKRNGELMMYSSQYRNLFNERSVRKMHDAIQSEQFYRDVLNKINEGNFEIIENDLNQLRDQLFRLDNTKVFVIGNIEELTKPVSSWTKFVDTYIEEESKNGEYKFNPDSFLDLPHSYQYQSELGEKCQKYVNLVITPAADSIHLISSTPIPTDYLAEDIFKIALATEFLTAVEGPFWRGIRGTGLAYGTNIRRSIETGYLTFCIYRGADAKQAWTTAKSIVDKFTSGETVIDSLSIESAIASIVNELANGESNSYDAAFCKISDNLFKRRGPNYVKHFLSKLSGFGKEDIIYALNKYFKPLFSSDSSVVFASVPSGKVEELRSFFTEEGYIVNTEEIGGVSSVDNNGEEKEHEDDDDDEEDDEGEYDSLSEEETGKTRTLPWRLRPARPEYPIPAA